MTHFVQPKPACLRQPKQRKLVYSIGWVAALPADSHWSRHYANPFPIANSGSRDTALCGKFANRHITDRLDLKLTLRFTVEAMMIATAVCASLLCVGVCADAQEGAAQVIACNLKAIGAAERPRYNDLMKRLRATVRDRIELPAGYVFKLDGKAITLPEVAEWINMERLCGPFLMLQLSASGNQAAWFLTLTGPAGVKALLQAEFPAQPK